jgi:hypothetical protein
MLRLIGTDKTKTLMVVEHALSNIRDTTEADLKQRREISKYPFLFNFVNEFTLLKVP